MEAVCREGPERVLELAAMGAAFTTGVDGSLHLTREGGHSHRRIVHAADVTGREIERALLANARAHPNIIFHEHHLAVDLVLAEVRIRTTSVSSLYHPVGSALNVMMCFLPGVEDLCRITSCGCTC